MSFRNFDYSWYSNIAYIIRSGITFWSCWWTNRTECNWLNSFIYTKIIKFLLSRLWRKNSVKVKSIFVFFMPWGSTPYVPPAAFPSLIMTLSKYISIEIPHIEIVKTDDYTFSKHKMIKGKTWSYHRFILNMKKQRKLAESLGKFISELHSVPCNEIKQNIIIPTIIFIGFINSLNVLVQIALLVQNCYI